MSKVHSIESFDFNFDVTEHLNRYEIEGTTIPRDMLKSRFGRDDPPAFFSFLNQLPDLVEGEDPALARIATRFQQRLHVHDPLAQMALNEVIAAHT
ncbi:hypothetical protein [Rhizobium arsenicireducens]